MPSHNLIRRFQLIALSICGFAVVGAGVTGCATTSSGAEESFPASINVDGKELFLNGTGLRKKLIFKVYTAGLYLEQKSQSAEEILNSEGLKVLQLQYHRDIDTDAAIQAFKDSFPINCKENCKVITPLLFRFDEETLLETPVTNGQIKTYTISSDLLGVKIEGAKNSQRPIAAESVGKEFLRVFIGDNPPSAALRDGLLGNP